MNTPEEECKKELSNPENLKTLDEQKQPLNDLMIYQMIKKCVVPEDIELAQFNIKRLKKFKSLRSVINFRSKNFQTELVNFLDQINKQNDQQFYFNEMECPDEIINKEHFRYIPFNFLYENVQELCNILGPRQTDIIQQIVKSFKNFENLSKYAGKFPSSEKFKKFMKNLKLLPEYQQYFNYLGVNISEEISKTALLITRKLTGQPYFKNTLKIEQIVNHLIKDPLYNFAIDGNLTFHEKQILFVEFWKDNTIRDFAVKKYYPNSIKKYGHQSVQKILGFLTEDGGIKYSENKQIVESILDFDQERFYRINTIQNSRKAVYQFIEEHIPNYFLYGKRVSDKKCKMELQIDIKFNLRRKVHQLGVPFEQYENIQNCILKKELMKLYDHQNLNFYHIKAIINYVNESKEIKCYWEINNIVPNHIEEVRNTLSKILIDVYEMKFSNITIFTNLFIQNGLYPEGFVIPKDYNEMLNKCSANKVLTQYLQTEKINFPFEQNLVKSQLIFIFHRISTIIQKEVMVALIQEFLVTNQLSVFYQSDSLTLKQKDQLQKLLQNSQSVKRYSNAFEITKSIESLKGLQSLMKNENDGQVLSEYYKKYGEITVNENGQIVLYEYQFLKSLEKLLKNDIEEVNKIQRSNEYKQFERRFCKIFQIEKEKTKLILIEKIKILAEQEKIRDIHLFLKEAEAINFDFDSQDAKYLHQSIIDYIKAKKCYRDYQQIKKYEKINQNFFKRTALVNSIKNLQNKRLLQFYSKEKRNQFLNDIASNVNNMFQVISQMDISKADKKQIFMHIQNSPEFKSYFPDPPTQQPQEPKFDLVSDFMSFLKRNDSAVFGEMDEAKAIKILNLKSADVSKELFTIMDFSLSKKAEREIVKRVFENEKAQIEKYMNNYLKTEAKVEESSSPKKQFKQSRIKQNQKQFSSSAKKSVQEIHKPQVNQFKPVQVSRTKQDIANDVLNILISDNEEYKTFTVCKIVQVLNIGLFENLPSVYKALNLGLKKKKVFEETINKNKPALQKLIEQFRK